MSHLAAAVQVRELRELPDHAREFPGQAQELLDQVPFLALSWASFPVRVVCEFDVSDGKPFSVMFLIDMPVRRRR